MRLAKLIVFYMNILKEEIDMETKLKPILKELQKNLMTGISYMMPLIIIAGVTMGDHIFIRLRFFDVSVFTEETLAA